MIYQKQLLLIPEPKEINIHKDVYLRFQPGCFPAAKRIIDSSFESEVGKEGYLLNIDKEGVRICADTRQGIFYGKMTLNQIFQQVDNKKIPVLEIKDWPDMPVRGLHLDFRVQRPKVDYLKCLLTRLAEYKVNQVIIEYEDHFPYSSDKIIPSTHAFTPSEIKEICDFARKHYIEIIPLQQCLGHVGYILKHNLYASLRELPNRVEMFCPQKSEVLELLERLISDMVNAHPGTRYLHIGTDEAYLLGECKECRDYVKRHSKSQLYVKFVTEVCQIVKRLGRQPIMWGDILLSYPEYVNRLPKDTIIHHWDYYSYRDKPNFIHNGYFGKDRVHPKGRGFQLYDQIKGLGLSVIGVPSARCAPDTSFSIDHTFHLYNIYGFCRKVANVKGDGIVNTSWSNSGDYITTLIDIGGANQQVFDAKLLSRRLPLEYNWYAILAGAAFSWSAETRLEKFQKAFNACFFGTNSDIAGIIHLLDGRPQKPEDYTVICRSAAQARRLLSKVGVVRQNQLAFNFIKVVAWLVEHKARREDTFRRYENALGREPAVVASARAAMCQLKAEEQKIKNAMHQVWSQCFAENEIEEDMFIHFGVADRKYARYIGRSK